MAEFGGKVLEMEAWSVRTLYTHIVLTHASNMAITGHGRDRDRVARALILTSFLCIIYWYNYNSRTNAAQRDWQVQCG